MTIATASPRAADPRRQRTRRGPGRPTANRAKQRDQELLDVALDLFYERGFEGTSIDAITAACNMAKRTVYTRYEDKTMLFKAALQHAIERWIVPIDRLQEAEEDDLEASLIRIGGILVDNVVSPMGQRLMRITYTEASRMPELGIYALKVGTDQTLAFLADLFRRRIFTEAGAMPDSTDTDAARGFIHLVVSGPAKMRGWGMIVDDVEIQRQTRSGVRLFLHGLLRA